MAAQQPARTSPELRARLHSARANVGITPRPGALPKTGARVVRHARAITFQLAEVAVSGNLFNRVLAAIQRLRAPPVPT